MLYKIEGLRGILVSLVILAHSLPIFYPEPQFMVALDFIPDLLFIISGYVISLVYQNRITKNVVSFKDFFLLRFARIYPLHLFMIIAIIVYLLMKQLLHLPQEFSITENIDTLLTNLLLLHSVGIHESLNWNFPSWSISGEFYTYLLYYIGLKTFDIKKSSYMPLLVSILLYSFLFFYIATESFAHHSYDLGMLRCIAGFYLGIFIFRLKNKLNYALKKKTIYIMEYFCVFVILLLISTYRPNQVIHSVLIIVTFGLLVFCFTESQNGRIGNYLLFDFLQQVGKKSYSIYMVHTLIIWLLLLLFRDLMKLDLSYGIKGLFFYLVTCLLTFLGSRFTYIYIEDFYRQKMKKYLMKNLKN